MTKHGQEAELKPSRRCGWCGVPLGWWQLKLCALCKGGPACVEGSRWEDEPDRFIYGRSVSSFSKS